MDESSVMGQSLRPRKRPFDDDGASVSRPQGCSTPLSLLRRFSLMAASALLLAPHGLWPVSQLQVPNLLSWIEIESILMESEAGTYYGVRFGKNIPWVTEFPFGVIRDPQYVGSVMSLVACVSWVPFQYILLWCLGYVFMMIVESKEDPSARAKSIS
ncbi:hypothetical protein Bca101_028078 [Brassica carinata]